MFERSTTLFAACLGLVSVSAQLSHGGEPIGTIGSLASTELPVFALRTQEVTDQQSRLVNAEFRYGVQRDFQVDVISEGRWDELGDGSRLCRVVLRSPGALMLSVQFDQWELAEGATVFLYDEEGTNIIGAFDRSNRGPDGSMATQVLPGDAVVIEYRVPAGVADGMLHVASVTHGTVDLFGFAQNGERDYNPGYQSAPCHINVNCPIASEWEAQKRSVVMFLRPDGAGCTAGLINNTAIPGKPYVHVAYHCLVESTMPQWVFYFNYDAPDCVGSSGPTTQTLTGVSMVSNYILDDFVLAELNTPPPPSYNVYYAGWDRSGNVPQSVTVLEHPLYDVKKIAFDNDPAVSDMDEYVHTWRTNWDNGITEWGASGAPCFDQNKRFIGSIVSGHMECGASQTTPASLGKFSESWDGFGPTSRLRDWLDPSNTVMVLDGYDPNAAVPAVNVRVRMFLEGPFDGGTGLMNGSLRAAGLVPTTEPYAAIGYPHTGGGGGETTTAAVLSNTGPNSVVDWVVVELRNKLNSAEVLATRSALLLRNGNVVDVDGVSDVPFERSPDDYFIALRHRNHLGIMTAQSLALDATPDLLDLSGGTVPLYGGAAATRTIAGVNTMFAGDANGDGTVRYTGLDNDRDLILIRVGGVVPTNSWAGYSGTDINMDGLARYTGGGNDRDVILVNIGGAAVTGTRTASLP
jgi:hypothetical protein